MANELIEGLSIGIDVKYEMDSYSHDSRVCFDVGKVISFDARTVCIVREMTMQDYLDGKSALIFRNVVDVYRP